MAAMAVRAPRYEAAAIRSPSTRNDEARRRRGGKRPAALPARGGAAAPPGGRRAQSRQSGQEARNRGIISKGKEKKNTKQQSVPARGASERWDEETAEPQVGSRAASLASCSRVLRKRPARHPVRLYSVAAEHQAQVCDMEPKQESQRGQGSALPPKHPAAPPSTNAPEAIEQTATCWADRQRPSTKEGGNKCTFNRKPSVQQYT